MITVEKGLYSASYLARDSKFYCPHSTARVRTGLVKAIIFAWNSIFRFKKIKILKLNIKKLNCEVPVNKITL